MDKTTHIIWGVTALTISAILAVTLIVIIKPSEDLLLVIGAIFGFVTASTTAVLAYLRTQNIQLRDERDEAEKAALRATMLLELASEKRQE